MRKKEIKGLLLSYLDVFYNKDIKTGKLQLLGKDVELLFYTTDGLSIFMKNIEGETRRIKINCLLSSKDINFKNLFKKHYKFFYEKKGEDLGYNKIIDELLKEI